MGIKYYRACSRHHEAEPTVEWGLRVYVVLMRTAANMSIF